MSDCILWERATFAQTGYGAIKRGGKVTTAHRWAWEHANEKKVPSGMFVCHSCDVRLCVNPKHLFLGTPNDNIQDAVAKNRIAHGEAHSQMKHYEIQEIRRLWMAGAEQKTLCRKFGMSPPAMSQMLSGKTWTHLAWEPVS